MTNRTELSTCRLNSCGCLQVYVCMAVCVCVCVHAKGSHKGTKNWRELTEGE